MLSCRGYIFQHRIRGEEGDGDRKSDAGGCTFKHIEGEECTVMVSGDIVFVFDPTIIRQPQSIWIIHERSWCLSFTFINIFIFYFIYMWNCILAGVNNSLITMDLSIMVYELRICGGANYITTFDSPCYLGLNLDSMIWFEKRDFQ